MTTKAYKIELLVIDTDHIGADSITTALENARYVYPKIVSVQARDLGEWTDDHPLNKTDKWQAEYDRLFGGRE